MEPGERSAVELDFGVGKRRFGLNLIMERLKGTSEVSIHTCILTMNLWKRLRELLFALIRWVLRRAGFGARLMVMQPHGGWCAGVRLETVVVQWSRSAL
jgi:hypothetical protein